MNIPEEAIAAATQAIHDMDCDGGAACLSQLTREGRYGRWAREALAVAAPVIAAQVLRAAPSDTSDGYHTFAELYDHRRALTRALMLFAPDLAWRSRAHHPDDGPIFGGYFICGMTLPAGQISYHYPVANWDDFDGVPIVDHGPKWDGHTAADVVVRLLSWAPGRSLTEDAPGVVAP